MDFDSGVAYQEMQEEQDTQIEIKDNTINGESYEDYLYRLSKVSFFNFSIEERNKVKGNLDTIASIASEYNKTIKMLNRRLDLLKRIKYKKSRADDIEFLEYLSELNFNNLDNKTLDYLKNVLEEKIKELKQRIWGPWRLVEISCFLLVFFLCWGNKLYFALIGSAICLPAYILIKIIKSCKKYKQYKNFSNTLLTSLDMVSSLRKSKSIISKTKEKLKVIEEAKKLEDKKIANQEYISLTAKINALESKILLLPKEEESPYQERLQKALSDFQKSRAIYSACEIPLLLCDKPAEIYVLENELASIERDLNSKSLFVNKDTFEIELSKKVGDYLTNISAVPMDDRWQTFGELRSSLLSLLNSDDIVRNLSISRAFAECFWETYLNANAEDEFAFRDLVCEEFIDAVILEGERILDNLEQDINVITIRSKLNQMKSRCSKREYLKYLAQDVRLTKSSRKLVRKNSDFHS